ncbi:MAG: hypothetical protein J3Q66DRAFT_444885 [Benniella sp.]|nr:MAG: hypothetical protein J3Q66DRAFT_444885 [Benniella sp.]
MTKGNLQIRAHYTTAHEMFRPVDETVWERVSQVSDIIGTPDTDRQFAEALGRSQLDLESLEWHVPCLETGMTARVIERYGNLRSLILNHYNLSEPEWMQALPSLTKHQFISFQNECEDVQPLGNRGRVFQACPQIRHPTCRSEGSSDGLRYILDTCVGLERLHIQTLHGAGVIMKLFQDGPWACRQLQEGQLKLSNTRRKPDELREIDRAANIITRANYQVARANGGKYWETVSENKLLTDAVEAIFDAVFLDSGMDLNAALKLFRRQETGEKEFHHLPQLLSKECLKGTIEEAFHRLSKHHDQEGMRTWTQLRAQYTTTHKMYNPVDEEEWERVSHVQDILDYQFQDRSLLVTAMRSQEGQHDVGVKTNDTLEYLGDSVLELLAPLFWITEGRWNKEVVELTSFALTNKALQAACLSHGLEEYLLGVTKVMQTRIVSILTEYEAAWTVDRNGAYWEAVAEYKTLADVVEALFGAVFLDCGMKFPVMQQLFRRLLSRTLSGYA